MADNENTVAAGDGMRVEETQEQQAEVSAQALMDAVASAKDAPEEAEQADGEAQEEEQESPEAAQRRAYTEGLTALSDMGWTQEELSGLIADAAALRDLKDGKTVLQAAHAYMKRQIGGHGEAPAKKSAPKKSVPTVRSASGTAKKTGSRIAEMSREEFRELSERAERAMLEGKNVSFD